MGGLPFDSGETLRRGRLYTSLNNTKNHNFLVVSRWPSSNYLGKNISFRAPNPSIYHHSGSMTASSRHDRAHAHVSLIAGIVDSVISGNAKVTLMGTLVIARRHHLPAPFRVPDPTASPFSSSLPGSIRHRGREPNTWKRSSQRSRQICDSLPPAGKQRRCRSHMPTRACSNRSIWSTIRTLFPVSQ